MGKICSSKSRPTWEFEWKDVKCKRSELWTDNPMQQTGGQTMACRQEGCRSTIVCCSLKWAEWRRNRKKSMWRAERQRSQGQTLLRPLTGILELTFSTSDACVFPPPVVVAAGWTRRSRPAHSFADLTLSIQEDWETGHSFSARGGDCAAPLKQEDSYARTS